MQTQVLSKLDNTCFAAVHQTNKKNIIILNRTALYSLSAPAGNKPARQIKN